LTDFKFSQLPDVSPQSLKAIHEVLGYVIVVPSLEAGLARGITSRVVSFNQFLTCNPNP
jgi:hypothetical protein